MLAHLQMGDIGEQEIFVHEEAALFYYSVGRPEASHPEMAAQLTLQSAAPAAAIAI